VPVGLLLAYRLLRLRRINGLALVAIATFGYFVGSAPWWVYNLEHEWAALAFYVPSLSATEDVHVQYTSNLRTMPIPAVESQDGGIAERALGLLLFGLPVLTGLRFSWSAEFFLPVIGLPVTFLYLAALYTLARDSQHRLLTANGRALTLGILVTLLGIFIFSQFGKDPTGRYLLPLLLVLGIAFATLIERITLAETLPLIARCGLQALLVAVVIGYQVVGQLAAVGSPSGLTTQFDPISHISNEYDDELIAFLDEHQLTRGYTHYWVAYRLAFLSDERLLYVPALPYKHTLIHRIGDDRFPPYTTQVAASSNFALITANNPPLDALLVSTFETLNTRYAQIQIGPYTVYYDFAPLPRVP
jgi:hypothetical protein